MKQFVGPVEGIADPKLLAEDLLDVRAAENAGIAVESIQEGLLLVLGHLTSTGL